MIGKLKFEFFDVKCPRCERRDAKMVVEFFVNVDFENGLKIENQPIIERITVFCEKHNSWRCPKISIPAERMTNRKDLLSLFS